MFWKSKKLKCRIAALEFATADIGARLDRLENIAKSAIMKKSKPKKKKK